MILGTGIDIIEISRIKKAYLQLGRNFVEKILHSDELPFFDRIKGERRKIEFLSGRFAAKEAFMKAKGIGMALSFASIIILNNEKGAPYILHKEANPKEQIHLSLSHSRDYAAATVLIEKISR